jgi:uncharacterized protein YlzI (FlbEa/FlbD family)
MKVTLILNGKHSMILTPETAVETEFLKQMPGATIQLVASKMNVLQNSIEGSLLISNDPNSSDERQLTK